MTFSTFNFDTPSKKSGGLIYLVDDDQAVRDSLRTLLETIGYHVEDFDSGELFLAKFDPNAVAVLLLDVRMQGMSGTEVQEHLIARKANLPIVFLTGHGDIQMAVSALKKGAADFLQKPLQPDQLIPILDKLLKEAANKQTEAKNQLNNASLLAKLTPRERQVLDCIVRGRLNKQIADDLRISIKTVEAHRASIMDKTDSKTVADLMRVVLGAQG